MSLFQLGVYWECRSKPGGMFPEITGGGRRGKQSKIHQTCKLSKASQPTLAPTRLPPAPSLPLPSVIFNPKLSLPASPPHCVSSRTARHAAEPSLPVLKRDLSRLGAELRCHGPGLRAAPCPLRVWGTRECCPLVLPCRVSFLQATKGGHKWSCLRGSHTRSITPNVIFPF